MLFRSATGMQYSVKECAEIAAEELGVTITWEGEGIDTIGVVSSIQDPSLYCFEIGDVIISVDPKYFRPAEVDVLLGDATKAKRELGWEPEISFRDMISEMMQVDMAEAKQMALLKKS